MTRTALSLGTNLGDRLRYMRRMEEELEAILDAPISRSRLMETEPLEVDPDQPWYLNRIIVGTFGGDPFDLLRKCQAVEANLGRIRVRGEKAPRTADIDILLFGEKVISSENLVIPHPALSNRRFCLEGLVEIEPDWVDPVTGKTIREMYTSMGNSQQNQQLRFIPDNQNGGL